MHADITDRLRLLPSLPHSDWRCEASAICREAVAEILMLREREGRHDRSGPTDAEWSAAQVPLVRAPGTAAPRPRPLVSQHGGLMTYALARAVLAAPEAFCRGLQREAAEFTLARRSCDEHQRELALRLI